MHKRKAVLAFFTTMTSLLIGSIAFSFAWFVTPGNIDFESDNKLTGRILQSYFDKLDDPSGDPGSQTNPFVITTPRHYENLVTLMTRDIYLSGSYVPFSEQDYYFEIGKKVEEGVYKVYGFDDFGRPTSGDLDSTTLNLKYLGDLAPMGNIDHPFSFTVEGHGIEIANFKVTPAANATEKYCDVGIFGYVKNDAKITNTFWSNFTIDTKGSCTCAHQDPTAGNNHDSNVRVGHLAGHIQTYASFDNCYVNACEMMTLNDSRQTDYGLYGLVEIDKNGAGTATGRTYSFSFNAEAWHQYLNTNRAALASMPLALRNTELSGGAVVHPEGNFGQAILNGDYVNSYWLNGSYVDTSSHSPTDANRTFSLSTTGYVSGEKEVVQKTFDLSYKDGSNYKQMNSGAKSSSYTADTHPVIKASAEDPNPTHYFYTYNNNKWSYYYTDNKETTAEEETPTVSKESMTCTFKFTEQDENQKVTWILYCPKETSLKFYLYIDDQVNADGSYKLFDSWDGTTRVYDGGSTHRHVYWGGANHEVTMPIGAHKYVMIAKKSYKLNKTTYTYYYSVSSGDFDTSAKSVTEVAFPTDYKYNGAKSRYEVSDVTIDLATKMDTVSFFDSMPETINNRSSYTPLPAGTFVVNTANKTYDLYFYDTDVQGYVKLETTSAVEYGNAIIEYSSKAAKWVVTVYKVVFVGPTEDHWMADDKQYIEPSNYKAKNIDVVGGGVGFYYYDFFYAQLRIIRMACERKISAFDKIKSDECNGTTKFYAPARVKQCIVCYIKNVGSALDNRNEDMGQMELTFVHSSLMEWLTIYTAYPTVLRGSLEHINIGSLNGGITASDAGTLRKKYTVKFDEWTVQKIAFACLDSQGNMLGRYKYDSDTTKKPQYDIGLNDTKAKKIDTYVVCFGGASDTTTNYYLWMTNVDFKFTAQEGAGGSFGAVGYRSSTDAKNTDTEMTFYVKATEGGLHFYVLVSYAVESDRKVYRLTVKCSGTLSITVYNFFYGDGVDVYVNNTLMDSSSNTYSITDTWKHPSEA